jgi:hypothetical protein
MTKSQEMPTSSGETPAPDPFDLEALRLPQEFVTQAGVKKLLTTVPLRKPNGQEFVRVHPDPNYRLDVLACELKDEGELYLVHPSVAAELEGDHKMITLFTAINRQKVIFLWPVVIPPPDSKPLLWWSSAREAAERAMTAWVKVKSNMALGAYEIYEALDQNVEPAWGDLPPYRDLLKIAAKGRLIDRADHPVIARLRGA